jgi:hypothetical protein
MKCMILSCDPRCGKHESSAHSGLTREEDHICAIIFREVQLMISGQEIIVFLILFRIVIGIGRDSTTCTFWLSMAMPAVEIMCPR